MPPFIQVPDQKRTKDRVHPDLRPADRAREEEEEELERLAPGANGARRPPLSDGSRWITLSDPEGYAG